MPNIEEDNGLDQNNTKEKFLKDFGLHLRKFSDKDEIEETLLLKKKLEKDIIKKSDTIKILQKQLDKHGHAFNLSSNGIDNTPYTSIHLKKDLYRFSGIQCVKMSNIKVFAFSTGEKVTNDNLFCVEILTTGNNLKLGKWVMPPSTDMKDILSEFPLDTNKNLKSFLKCCKQHVNCYSYRQEQYNNLKNILSNTVNCSLDANLGFTRIHLHMSGIEQIDPGEIYNIMLFMAYKSNEALPYLISIETQDNTLSPKMNKIFNKYFKPFKIFNLSAAFERIIDDNRHFIWKKVSKVSNNFDEYITEEKDEESISRDIESNDTKKVNSQSSLEQDLKELQIENGNSNYSSNSMENKARPKSNNRRNKNKLVKENLDTIIKTQKINKQKKDLEKSSTNTVTKKKIKENISVNENKVQAALKDTFTNNNIDQSTKNEESREKKESKSPSITEDSVKNVRRRRTRTNDTNKNKSKTALNKMFDKTNVQTVAREINESDKKINLPMKSTETTLLKNEEETPNITKNSLKENPYKYFSSTPKLNTRKAKSEDVRLPEISAITSLSTNRGSNQNLTNILNENDDNSSSTIDQDSEKEQLNEMQTSELLRDIKVASKTIKKKDGKKKNTSRKTNKRKSVKKQQNKKGN
ncbi:hypothetical protein M0804_007603 [Polistes exclamans]|nr:hypothetical protein M0804_007603 [Polistes exclamans]